MMWRLLILTLAFALAVTASEKVSEQDGDVVIKEDGKDETGKNQWDIMINTTKHYRFAYYSVETAKYDLSQKWTD